MLLTSAFSIYINQKFEKNDEDDDKKDFCTYNEPGS